MRLDVSMEELFPVPVARVWHALTDAQMISRWLMATSDFEPTVGTRFILRDQQRPGFRGYVECEVLELSPPPDGVVMVQCRGFRAHPSRDRAWRPTAREPA